MPFDVALDMGSVGQPWCMQACIEVAYMLGSQPLPRGFLSHVIGHAKVLPVYLMEEGSHQLLHPDNFLQVMHDQFTQLPSFMPSHGLFHGIPSSYWSNDDITPLPAKALPSLGEPSNQGCYLLRLDFVHMLCVQARLLWPSFLIQLLKGKQLQFTEQLHTEHFVHHGSHIPGK